MIKDTPRLAIRRSPENPNHHLWLNNGVWWYHITLQPTATGSVRKRFSLKTHSLEAAKTKRDRILTALKTTHFDLLNHITPTGTPFSPCPRHCNRILSMVPITGGASSVTP